MSRQLVIALSAMLAVLSLPGVASGEEDPKPTYAFLVDPGAPIVGGLLGNVLLEFEFQWAPHDYIAISVIPSLAYREWTSGGRESAGVGGGVRIGPRFLSEGRRLGGAYVFPFAGIIHVTAGLRSNSSTLQYVPIGLEAGYAWVWQNGLVINLGGGFSYEHQLADPPDDLFPISPILNFTLGYAW